MRRPADENAAAFHQFDGRLAGLYLDVAAAAKRCFHLAVLDVHLHGAGNENVFAIDGADGVEGRLIGARGPRGDENRAAQNGHRREDGGATSQMTSMEKLLHSGILQRLEREILAYTIR